MEQKPSIRVDVDTIVVDENETLTVWLGKVGVDASQVELRVMPNGKRQIFIDKNQGVEVLDFQDDWKPMERVE